MTSIICMALLINQTHALQIESLKRAEAWMVGKGTKFSTLDKLSLQKAPLPLPGANQKHDDDDDTASSTLERRTEKAQQDTEAVTIATKAIGLNFADIFTVLGLYSAANEARGKESAAFIPGLEFSGEVGHDPTGEFEKGDRILGFTRFGAYSDIVSVSPSFLKRLPAHWSFAEGASFLVQALTAWHGLIEIGRMPVVKVDGGEKPFVVIIHSASGGVGLWASEIVARRGGIVIGIVGSEAKEKVFFDRIKALSPKSQTMIRGKENDFKRRLAKKLKSIHSSYDSGIDLSGYNYDLEKMAKDGYGSNIVMESLGGKYFTASYESLNAGGALVTFGSTSYVSPGLGLNMFRLIYRYLTRPRIDPGKLTSRNIQVCGFNLIYLTERTEDLRRELNECIACLSGLDNYEGKDEITMELVKPPTIGESFDFRTEAVEAMKILKGGNTVGKVVLDNSNNPCCIVD